MPVAIQKPLCVKTEDCNTCQLGDGRGKETVEATDLCHGSEVKVYVGCTKGG